MREMKDSGIEWIKQIPTGWTTTRGKNILQLMKRPPEPFDEVITCFRDGEVTLRKKRREEGFTFSDKEIGYQGIKKGDLVIHGMDGFAGAIGISDSDGKGSPVLVVCTTKENSWYLVYYLRTLAMQDVFLALATGIRERSCDLRWNKVADLLFPIPELNEQRRIADYLDRKCAKIDAIIARQQQVIEKLKVYKLSVITETVTKGLNPDVPMKDSGIEWMGMIPAHWDILKLRAHTRMLTPMRDRPKKLDGDIPWVRIEDYDGKYISATKEGLGVSPETVQEMNLKIYPIGSILCTSSCDLGKCAIVTKELVSNQRFINIIPDSDTDSDYLYYLMLSNAERLNHLSTGTIQANLSRKAFEHLMVQFPPNSEQKEIAGYLDGKCEKIESSISKKQALIDKLTEYKKSLIYEVVTGKREITEDLSVVTSVAVLAPALIAELREKRAVLMTRFIDGLGDKTKGRVQIQKCMSLAEGLIDLQLGMQFVRKQYGPYDEDIQTYEQIMAEHEWMNHAKKKGRIQYTRGKRFQEYHSVYQRFFGNYDREIQRIIDFVKPIKRTSEIGRMATLFAAWNDFILDGIPNPTDEQIISEARGNWTENKENTPVETWQDSLNKLRAAGMVPCGYGRHTVKLEEGDRTHG